MYNPITKLLEVLNMGVYDKKQMRGMTQASFNDTRMNKRRELNETMSINTSKTEDAYGNQVHSLSKQSYTDNEQQ